MRQRKKGLRKTSMNAGQGFSTNILAALRRAKILRIRAGASTHRFIGIWVVVVNDRVFIRSWSIKPNGWYRTFLKKPHGAIRIGDAEIPVRTLLVKSKQLRDAIDRAYLEKYNTPSSLKYAKDLGEGKCRATTTELVPVV